MRLQLLVVVVVVVGSELSPVTSVLPGDAGSPVSPPLLACLGWLGFTFPKYAIGMQPAYTALTQHRQHQTTQLSVKHVLLPKTEDF